MNNCLLYRAAHLFSNKSAIRGEGIDISFIELYRQSLAWDNRIKDSLKDIFVIKATCSPEYIAIIFSIIRNNKIYLPISAKENSSFIDKLCLELNAEYIDPNSINEPTKCLDQTIDQAISCDYSDDLTKLLKNYLRKPCNIILSSGSTGTPKKIVHSLEAHVYSALGGQAVFKINKSDSYLLSLPLNHVGGQSIIFKCVLFGAQMLIPDKFNFTTEQLLLKNQVSVLSLVPTQAYRLCNLPTKPIANSDSLRAILLGGAPIDKQLIKQMKDQNKKLNIFGSYGSSEMASQICTAEISQQLCAGLPLPYRELKIEQNEILVRGETLALGYYKNGIIENINDENGWFHTKDFGELSDIGIIIKGRIDNQFICGGENIIPEMIEQVLLELPNINMAIVVPIEDPEWGNIACAIVDSTCLNEAIIKQSLLTRLNPIYIPKIFIKWPQDIEVTFKVKRKLLHEYAKTFLATNRK